MCEAIHLPKILLLFFRISITEVGIKEYYTTHFLTEIGDFIAVHYDESGDKPISYMVGIILSAFRIVF